MMDDTAKQIRENGLEALGRFYGKYRAEVFRNDDPDKLGRLMLKCEQIWGEEPHEYWAYPESPYLGMVFLPEVGDMVWIECEMGDPSYPIWTGVCWYEGKMPAEVSAKYIALKLIKSLSGHKIELDDSDGSENLTMTAMTGDKITMRQEGILIEDNHGHKVDMTSGGILIQDSVGNKIDITVGGISITTPAGTCSLNGGTTPINNLPLCLFTGAPHGSNPKNLG